MEVITLSLCGLLRTPPLVACFLWALSSSLSLSMNRDGEFLPFSEEPAPIPCKLLPALRLVAFPIGFFLLPNLIWRGIYPPVIVGSILTLSFIANTKRNILSILLFGTLAFILISFSPSPFLNAVAFSTLAYGDTRLTSDEETELNPYILFAFLPFISLVGGFPLILKVNPTYKILFNFCVEGFFLNHFFTSPNSRIAITTFLSTSHSSLNPSHVFILTFLGFTLGAILAPYTPINPPDWKHYPLFTLAAVASFPGGIIASVSAFSILAIPLLGIPARGLPMIYSFPYLT